MWNEKLAFKTWLIDIIILLLMYLLDDCLIYCWCFSKGNRDRKNPVVHSSRLEACLSRSSKGSTRRLKETNKRNMVRCRIHHYLSRFATVYCIVDTYALGNTPFAIIFLSRYVFAHGASLLIQWWLSICNLGSFIPSKVSLYY